MCKVLPMEMKTIVYRGGLLKFRIPESWKEEYSDIDGGTFYEDVPDSGTLRVKVITLEIPEAKWKASVGSILQPLLLELGKSEEDVHRIGGNELVRYEEHSSENGVLLRTFYWVFGKPVPPRNARVVTFSYTIPDSLLDTEQVRSELEMLEPEIRETEFAPHIGVSGSTFGPSGVQ